jgi:sulfonate transport system substrate-binding protein
VRRIVDDASKAAGSGRKRLLLIGLLLLAVVGAFLWWRSDQGGNGAGQPRLVVGDQRGGIQALLKAAGELEDVPYEIGWALFPAASPLLEALASGAVDLGGVGGAPFAFAYAGGAPIKVVFATRAVNGHGGKASAIVVPRGSSVRTLADLRGKRVATVRGSAGQNLVLRLLEKENIGLGEIKWTYLQNGEAKAALAAGSVDAWSTWGSYVGIALQEDGDRSIADGTSLESEAGFYAANVKAIDAKRAQLTDFLARAARARAWARTHRAEYARVLAEDTGIPLAIARFTVDETIVQPVVIDDSLRSEQQAILERYRSAGMIPGAPKLDGAFDPSFNRLPTTPDGSDISPRGRGTRFRSPGVAGSEPLVPEAFRTDWRDRRCGRSRLPPRYETAHRHR